MSSIRDWFEDELRAFQGGKDGIMPCVWENEPSSFPQVVTAFNLILFSTIWLDIAVFSFSITQLWVYCYYLGWQWFINFFTSCTMHIKEFHTSDFINISFLLDITFIMSLQKFCMTLKYAELHYITVFLYSCCFLLSIY